MYIFRTDMKGNFERLCLSPKHYNPNLQYLVHLAYLPDRLSALRRGLHYVVPLHLHALISIATRHLLYLSHSNERNARCNLWLSELS
jgi:hypothetical protein